MQFRRITGGLLLTVAFLFAMASRADSEPPAYTLDALFRMAFSYSEEVKLAKESVYVASTT